MKFNIIAVGKIKKNWINAGMQEYLKRLPQLDIIEIKDASKEKELSKILSLVKKNDKLIPLSETGELLTSLEFASFIKQEFLQPLVFVIGGPEGLSEQINNYAYKVLSLSKMTLPHEMARLCLVEQLYRAYTIIQNKNYHK
ncbi:MAG: 23S rRNA (pseudouridine(1915)-N(3))-methyltransferase RlmH [Symploca sp. SIO2G7]|nr:23S rRNA (pseudouridine(1915)-N(3))-methyltransferase RlmH [Symploca sp. SIO2G7]